MTIRRVIIAEMRKLMAIPAKRSVFTDFCFPIKAIPIMRKRVAMADAIAANGIPKVKADRPVMIAMAAPNEAPEEMPRI
jgi:hypothetical protein